MMRLALLLGLATLASAEAERPDLFDRHGRRTGYAVINARGGRVDVFDRASKRIAWGHMCPDGRVELFGLDGGGWRRSGRPS